MKNVYFIIAILLIILINSPVALATDEFVFDEDTGTITSYTGDSQNLVIPEEINGVKVKKLAEYSFAGKNFRFITIPKTITEIDEVAFDSCMYLESIMVSDANEYYTSIDGVLFKKDLEAIVLYPGNKKDLDYTIPQGVKNFNSNNTFAFNNHMERITIPDTMELNDIKRGLGNLANLISIIVADDNPNLCSIDGVLFDKEIVILINYPRNKKDVSKYIVPETVKFINRSAFFANESLEEIILPEGIIRIGIGSLNYLYNLKTINLPESITEIGHLAFASDESLEKIILPLKITTIEDLTFSSCIKLKEVVIAENVKSIGAMAFMQCNNLETINIPNKLTSIGEQAFYFCFALQKLTIPNSVIEIGSNAFASTNPDFTIYGEKNSYAQTYAKENGVPFIIVDDDGNEIVDLTVENAITSLPTDEAKSDAVEEESSYVYIWYILIAIAVIFGIIMIILKKRNSK